MFFSGLADEAAPDLEGQIKAHQDLGWRHLEARNVDFANVHDLPERDFDRLAGRLKDSGIQVHCFASSIANWGKKISEPFDSSLEEARRAIPRMKRLGARHARIMSFAVLEDRGPDDQMEKERFRRLRVLTRMFADAGLQALHENCMNYGGMAWTYTLRLLENVPGLRLVFDTGNPCVNFDRRGEKPWQRQDAWEFYEKVRGFVDHVQVKDGFFDEASNKDVFSFPGEGKAQVRRIVRDLLERGYDGGLSIEPHMIMVFHDPRQPSAGERRRMAENYVEYGRRLMRMVGELRHEITRQAAGQA